MYQGALKKDLRKIQANLDNVILIDDTWSNTVAGQERNHLKVFYSGSGASKTSATLATVSKAASKDASMGENVR